MRLRAATTCTAVLGALATPAAAKQLKNLPMASERIRITRWFAVPLQQHRLKDDGLRAATTCLVCYGSACEAFFYWCRDFGQGPRQFMRTSLGECISLVGMGLGPPFASRSRLFGAWLPSALRAGLREVSHVLSSLLFVAEHLFSKSSCHCVAYWNMGGSLATSSFPQWHSNGGRLKAPMRDLR